MGLPRTDWEIVRNHGDQQTAHLGTRYNLETHDGAVIYLRTTGTRTGRREVLEALGEGKIGPDQFRMRLNLTFETGDARYSWLNDGVFVASSGRVGSQGELLDLPVWGRGEVGVWLTTPGWRSDL